MEKFPYLDLKKYDSTLTKELQQAGFEIFKAFEYQLIYLVGKNGQRERWQVPLAKFANCAVQLSLLYIRDHEEIHKYTSESILAGIVDPVQYNGMRKAFYTLLDIHWIRKCIQSFRFVG